MCVLDGNANRESDRSFELRESKLRTRSMQAENVAALNREGGRSWCPLGFSAAICRSSTALVWRSGFKGRAGPRW